MSWTDDRVAKLRELWGSGKSASEIAEVLGGVSRNAVIGKAHRLNLSGRPSPIRKKEAGAAPAASGGTASGGSASGGGSTARPAAPRPATPARPAAAAATATQPAARKAEPRPASPPTPRPQVVEIGGDATILSLTERMCRWPIGDPKQPGFRFCGRSAAAGMPYCAEHAKVAYQPPSSGRKRDDEKQTA